MSYNGFVEISAANRKVVGTNDSVEFFFFLFFLHSKGQQVR